MKKRWLKSANKNIKKMWRTSSFDKEYELKDLKKSVQIDQEIDYSYLDEATKLKEEEIAKTTLINDPIEIENLFNLNDLKKK